MRSFKQLVTGVILIALGLSACKDAYITDGGVYNTVSSVSTYDYLKANRQFDTLILIVDHFNLKDSVNSAATFYAFTDFAAKKFMVDINCTSLDQLYDLISAKFITQYMFAEKVMVSDVILTPVLYPNWAKSAVASCALAKAEYVQNIYLTNSAASFKYYQMEYVSVNGAIDNASDAPPGDPVDVTLRCQTADVLTGGGAAVMHIFANNVSLKKI